METTIPTVGVNDILWGEGYAEVPTYGGGKVIKEKMNLSNMPYNTTQTVAQALLEVTTLLTSSDYATIQRNIQEIKALHDIIPKLNSIYLKSGDISVVTANLAKLSTIVANIETLKKVPNDLERVEQVHRDLNYVQSRFMAILDNIKEEVSCQSELISGKLIPLSLKMDATNERLDALVAEVKAEITQGNEMAQKMGSYSLEIQALRQCANPKIIVDDINKRIIWQVPRNNCYTVVNQVGGTNQAEVQALIDASIANLNTQGGSLAPITQEQANIALEEGLNG